MYTFQFVCGLIGGAGITLLLELILLFITLNRRVKKK